MFAIQNIKTGKFVYGTDYRYFPRHQRTYNCLNHARADFISCMSQERGGRTSDRV